MSQTTKTTPVTNTMSTGESPTASSIATITIIAIAFVVSFPVHVMTPPLLLLPDSPQARHDGHACLLRRKLSSEISGRLICRDRTADSVFYFVTQRLEA